MMSIFVEKLIKMASKTGLKFRDEKEVHFLRITATLF